MERDKFCRTTTNPDLFLESAKNAGDIVNAIVKVGPVFFVFTAEDGKKLDRLEDLAVGASDEERPVEERQEYLVKLAKIARCTIPEASEIEFVYGEGLGSDKPSAILDEDGADPFDANGFAEKYLGSGSM